MIANGMIEIEIITATAIYYTEQDDISLWNIKVYYDIWRELMSEAKDEKDYTGQVQAWQYVKAYIQMLKDRNHWDKEYGRPKYGPLFMELDPESDNWVDYYIRHPEEQEDMNEFNKMHILRKRAKEVKDARTD